MRPWKHLKKRDPAYRFGFSMKIPWPFLNSISKLHLDIIVITGLGPVIHELSTDGMDGRVKHGHDVD